MLFHLNKRSPIGWIQIKEKSNDCITLSFNLYQPNVSLGAEFKKDVHFVFAMANDKIMGVDSGHDRKVICVKVVYIRRGAIRTTRHQSPEKTTL